MTSCDKCAALAKDVRQIWWITVLAWIGLSMHSCSTHDQLTRIDAAVARQGERNADGKRVR